MAAQGLYKKIQESALGFVIDKVFSIFAGLAVAIVVSIFVPVAEIVFRLYLPLSSFLEKYVYFCIAVFFLTIIMWIIIWRRPKLRRLIPYIISFISVGVSGLMRGEILFPNIIGVQFVLFFGGILVFCEALFIHLILLLRDLAHKLRS